MSQDTHYHAFISYRHADNKEQGRQWATWLHQAIETYEVPADLVGKINARGDEIHARIYPVFRDEQELPAHADLGTSITQALDSTRLLIVLCSPNAVASTYVADEIDYFKKKGHSDRIIAAMINGEPNTSWDTSKQKLGFNEQDECFPEPLQFEYDAQGNQATKRAEPIAADFRINNNGQPEQGWTTPEAYRQYLKETTQLNNKQIQEKIEKYQQQQNLMLLKIIAGILGVPLGELTQRDKEYQLEQERLRAQKLKRWLSGVAILAIVAVISGVFALIQREEAVEQRKEAQEQKIIAEEQTKKTQIALEESEYNLGQAHGEKSRFLYVWQKYQQAAMHAIQARKFSSYVNFDLRSVFHKLLQEPVANVATITFSPDGDYLVSGSNDHAIRFWDMKTQMISKTLKGHAGAVKSLDFTADGKLMVSASDDKTIRIWDAKTHKTIKVLKGHGEKITRLDISPDDKRIASASKDKTVRLWNITSGKLINVLKGHSSDVTSVAFSSDGKLLASGSINTIALWDVKTVKILKVLTDHKSDINALAFSPDGKLLVSGGYSKTIYIWDVQTGKSIKTIEAHRKSIKGLAFSADGKTLASTDDGDVTLLHDVKTGILTRVFTGPTGYKENIITLGGRSVGVAFSPGGKYIATSTSMDDRIRLWGLKVGQLSDILENFTVVHSTHNNMDFKKVILVNSDNVFFLWDQELNKLKKLLSLDIYRGNHSFDRFIASSPDQSIIATSSEDKIIYVRELKTSKVLKTLSGHNENIRYLHFSPDMKHLVSMDDSFEIMVWNLENDKKIRIQQKEINHITSIRFSPDGKLLATSSYDKTARLWNVETGKEIKQINDHNSAVKQAIFSHNGELLVTADNEGKIFFWDLKKGFLLKRLNGEAGITALSFSYDDKLLASSHDNKIRLWDATTGQTLMVLKYYSSPVTGISFSKDKKKLISSNIDEEVRVWDIAIPLKEHLDDPQAFGKQLKLKMDGFEVKSMTVKKSNMTMN